MKSSSKLLSILAASSLVASIPVVLAQGAPPPAPPPAPPAAAPMASGAASGRNGGAPQDTPTTEEIATLNKALKALLSKDEAAAKVYSAHPTWAGPLNAGFGGGNGRGGNAGGGSGRGGRGAGA